MNIGWIIAFAAGILIIRFATGLLLKILGLACLVGGALILMYNYGIWPFREQTISIEWLEKQYCDSENPDRLKCNCIVKKIKRDIDNRFTNEELDAMSENRLKVAYTLKKSYDAQLVEIKSCLGANAEIELKEFNDALWHRDQETLKKTGQWLSEKSGSIKESFQELKDEKSSIDRKYE